MAEKASALRVERYSQRVLELEAAKKMALLKAICWIAAIIIDCIVGVAVFYQDESIGYEPVFWIVFVGITIACCVGFYRNYYRFTKARESYEEASEKLAKLAGRN